MKFLWRENGLFGVTKDELAGDGTEIFRLIMNLVPLNGICEPLSGDVSTLPTWSMMQPLVLQPSEYLVVSSEDVKCFFYTMKVPSCWWKYLAFNKEVPHEYLPPHLREGRVYVAATVLPMGFLNSVSLAQHVHRNLTKMTYEDAGANAPGNELRKDRTFTHGNPAWRIYLDNYDLLERIEAVDLPSFAIGWDALRAQYGLWRVPRKTQKSVQRATKCEVQGATVDGTLGVAYPRESKLCKYLQMAFMLITASSASLKQWQVTCGGLVYFAMFRRSLLGSLNQVWAHMEDFGGNTWVTKPVPDGCRLELARFLGLLPLARLDFRVDVHPQVACSDASTTGGGVCCSSGVTQVGSMVSNGAVRGEPGQQENDLQVVSIGLFDGIGALRVALDLQGVRVLGHVSVEQHEPARRVVESHYPGTIHVSNVEDVDDSMVRSWSLQFSQCSAVVLGGGPPCQGVSGLNADRKGALRDKRSCLFSHVSRIRSLVQKHFAWCPTYSLMESVGSMDVKDMDIMSNDFGTRPIRCDSGTMTWCHRPRLYWVTWELHDGPGAACTVREPLAPDEWVLTAEQPIHEVLKPGWLKVEPLQAFPTFTTSRPREHPGRKPAGLSQCNADEVLRWQQDQHRFPPYQYMLKHSVVNSRNHLRLPDADERELMLGFPLHYTKQCLPKAQRKTVQFEDERLSLLGNSWSVPVVAWLLNQLLAPLGLAPSMTPQHIMDQCQPGASATVQGRLQRLPLAPAKVHPGDSQRLASKLSGMISIKGEDILLTTPTSQMVKHHRLRASVPSKLWKWKIITGWTWKNSSDHINVLELRAVMTAIKWRIEMQKHIHRRFIHLTDSLVCLHALSRGRSSSRKLRRVMSRINALVLVSGSQPVWGYVHTDQNPADKPSRWGRRVRTKYRNA
eukprot:Skav233435  [mRNA]  locus=scaffold1486:284964:287666:- [translate_table: standard]